MRQLTLQRSQVQLRLLILLFSFLGFQYSLFSRFATHHSVSAASDLNLTSMCQPDDGLYLIRVRNYTYSDIEYVWKRNGGTISEVLLAPANDDTYFIVSHHTNPTVIIYWDEDYTWDEEDIANTRGLGGVSSKTKATNTSTCSDEFVAAFGILPVEWLFWEAKIYESYVALHWATSTEVNSSHFEIERSYDGKNFSAIANQLSAGNTSDIQQYSFRDTQPIAGTSYYRLKQVDLDGTVDYTPIIEVYYQPIGSSSLKVYPTHIKDRITVSSNAEHPESLNLEIFSIGGQAVLTQQHLVGQGYHEWHINISHIPIGIYYYKISNSGSQTTGKLIKGLHF